MLQSIRRNIYKTNLAHVYTDGFPCVLVLVYFASRFGTVFKVQRFKSRGIDMPLKTTIVLLDWIHESWQYGVVTEIRGIKRRDEREASVYVALDHVVLIIDNLHRRL